MRAIAECAPRERARAAENSRATLSRRGAEAPRAHALAGNAGTFMYYRTGMADIYTRLVDEQARARTTHNYKAYGMLPTTTVILHR